MLPRVVAEEAQTCAYKPIAQVQRLPCKNKPKRGKSAGPLKTVFFEATVAFDKRRGVERHAVAKTAICGRMQMLSG